MTPFGWVINEGTSREAVTPGGFVHNDTTAAAVVAAGTPQLALTGVGWAPSVHAPVKKPER